MEMLKVKLFVFIFMIFSVELAEQRNKLSNMDRVGLRLDRKPTCVPEEKKTCKKIGPSFKLICKTITTKKCKTFI